MIKLLRRLFGKRSSWVEKVISTERMMFRVRQHIASGKWQVVHATDDSTEWVYLGDWSSLYADAEEVAEFNKATAGYKVCGVCGDVLEGRKAIKHGLCGGKTCMRVL